MQKLIYTPIRKTYKKNGEPDSRKDFEEQERLTEQGYTWMWDADPKNKAKIGDVFAFAKNENKVQFHIVDQVYNPAFRLPTWRDNVGQQNRNVLYLSEPIYTMDWEKWIALNGAKKVQGTAVASKDKSCDILQFISNL